MYRDSPAPPCCPHRVQPAPLSGKNFACGKKIRVYEEFLTGSEIFTGFRLGSRDNHDARREPASRRRALQPLTEVASHHFHVIRNRARVPGHPCILRERQRIAVRNQIL
jgi:hypothetical protein